jgi:hypothetical protein
MRLQKEIKDCLKFSGVEYDRKATPEELLSLLKTSDKVNWCYVSEHQKLSEDFIREFKNKVHWYDI